MGGRGSLQGEGGGTEMVVTCIDLPFGVYLYSVQIDIFPLSVVLTICLGVDLDEIDVYIQ